MTRFLFIGFGSVGSSTSTLLCKRFGVKSSDIKIVTKETAYAHVLESNDLKQIEYIELTRSNYKEVLDARKDDFEFMVNVSMNVSSIDLIKWCSENDRLYIDTSIEPWIEGDTNKSNCELRDEALTLKSNKTTILCHGANPGLAQHFVKKGLEILYDQEFGPICQIDQQDHSHAFMSYKLGVKTIQIAERDTQVSSRPREVGEFVNTWSVDGFYEEGLLQKAEIGMGTHEIDESDQRFKSANEQGFVKRLVSCGWNTRCLSWTPNGGLKRDHMVVTHHETSELSDHLNYIDPITGHKHRPTVYYAYKPCDEASKSIIEVLTDSKKQFTKQHIYTYDDIESGSDAMGILFVRETGSHWFGSVVDKNHCIEGISPTAMQISSGVVGAIQWAIQNPDRGVIEPFDMDSSFVLDLCAPYLGDVVFHNIPSLTSVDGIEFI